MNEAAVSYVNAIRNKRKREYARAYRLWLVFGKCGPEPQAGKLSFMAAQAVRNQLAVSRTGTTSLKMEEV